MTVDNGCRVIQSLVLLSSFAMGSSNMLMAVRAQVGSGSRRTSAQRPLPSGRCTRKLWVRACGHPPRHRTFATFNVSDLRALFKVTENLVRFSHRTCMRREQGSQYCVHAATWVIGQTTVAVLTLTPQHDGEHL